MRCFDFHKIFQDLIPSVPNTSALGFARVPGVVRKKHRSEFFSIKSRERERVERRSDLPILFLYSFD